ncbi:MAG: phosphate uptake regulator PhoU [Ignisphaera sp.]|nr:phosphate uptake regulator PhoU [Ignisphaera sp.]MDW8084832.1 phosphate uptake regulator PhoU [Ignisphaera sp.]
MRRVYRLQSIGGSIYVALPREWLRSFNLDKGSPVEMTIDADGSIKIQPVGAGNRIKSELGSRIVVDVNDVKSTFNAIITSYLRGFDIITINFAGGAMEREIKRILDDARQVLLGLEIIDMDSSSVTLQILSTVEGDVPSLIRNMGKIARSMYLDALNALVNGDSELAEAVPLRDFDLNRLYFYVTRTIRKKIVSSSIDQRDLLKLVDLRMTAKAIEEMGDEAKKAARGIAQLIQLNSISNELLHRFKKDVDGLDEIFGKIIRKGLFLSADLVELYDDMRMCEDLRRDLSELKNNIMGNSTREHVLFKVIYAYENIAVRIYDVLSLVPLKFEVER